MKWNPPTQLPEDGQKCIVIAKADPDYIRSHYVVAGEFEKYDGSFSLVEHDSEYDISIQEIEGWMPEEDLVEHFKRSQND